jgi:HSP20 family protein
MNIVHYRQWPARRPGGAFASAASAGAQWLPQVDIREESDRFVIRADLPGVDPQDIEVQMDKGVLSIQGERKADAVAEGAHYTRVERRNGSFNRRFALPDSADADGIVASGRNGVLEISIPKKPQATPRRIRVGVETVQ